jgi:hypothetical protein
MQVRIALPRKESILLELLLDGDTPHAYSGGILDFADNAG